MLDTVLKKFPCDVYANGHVSWIVAGSFESSCDLNMHKFPFDTQTCSLDFGSLVNVDSRVHLYAESDSVDLIFYVPSKGFRYS